VGVVEDKKGVGGGWATASSIEKKLLSLRRLGWTHTHTFICAKITIIMWDEI
jgi:hypothetical protein